MTTLETEMRRRYRLFATAPALVAVLLGFAITPGARAAHQKPEGAPKRVVLDFSHADQGGVGIGNFNNVAFPIRFTRPLEKERIPFGSVDRADLVATFDYATCSPGQEPLLEKPLANLGRGDAAWVDAVEIETLPHVQPDLPWQGGVCYGVRALDGTWSWYLATVPLEREGDGRVHARLPIDRGPIDAIKLVFDARMPIHYAHSVTLFARPMPKYRSPR